MGRDLLAVILEKLGLIHFLPREEFDKSLFLSIVNI